ncbi:hypothetical protein BJV77DRAFT_241864 [Russula vinacea]|nr:hypothetical protein BJV77DRAFT_241864 [Russula vinacea]
MFVFYFAFVLGFVKLVYVISVPPDTAHIFLYLSPSSGAILASLAQFSLLPVVINVTPRGQ